MIEEIFKEIKEEAVNGIVTIKDSGFDVPVRICFSLGEDKEGASKFVIKDLERFNKLLKDYVYCSLEFYNLQPTKDNIKAILTYV